MAWPTLSDFNEAVQNPQTNFHDLDLKAGCVATNAMGLPIPISGNFATVYKVQCGTRTWAVRCFQRDIADQQQRYAAISSHLTTAKLPYTVGFNYQPQGIKIRGQWYPIVKMEWVRGELLNAYIEKHLHDSLALFHLVDRWAAMANALQRAHLAHGDLSHGNVLVINGDFKLIDYDGMYVPALAGRGSNETGHRNYQHPQRTGAHFGLTLDNFSLWVIYISLIAFSIDPSLWQRAKASEENLLFRKNDLGVFHLGW